MEQGSMILAATVEAMLGQVLELLKGLVRREAKTEAAVESLGLDEALLLKPLRDVLRTRNEDLAVRVVSCSGLLERLFGHSEVGLRDVVVGL